MFRHLQAITTQVQTLKSRRGATATEYLLMIAVVAGVGVPLFMKYLGGPIQSTFRQQRQNLVTFIGQTPPGRRRVPDIWFSQERLADPRVKDLPSPIDQAEVGEVGEPGNLREPRDFRVGDVRTGTGVGTGRLDSGTIPTSPQSGIVGGGSGSGGSGLIGAPGGSSEKDNALSGDFFASATTSPTGVGTNDESRSSGIYGAASGEASSEEGGGGRREDGGKQETLRDKTDTSSHRGTAEAKKRSDDAIRSIEQSEAAKVSKVDWWFIIKLLILLLIAFLILLIAVSNMKRRA